MSVESFQEIYCVEQINIPVTFPHILKTFAKAAIRTQPYDLLRWTSAYFRALANGQVPPVKERFEYPPFDHPTGLTPRYLKTLLNQLGHTNISSSITNTITTTITSTKNNVTLKTLLDCWQGIVLSETVLYQILMIGHLLNDDKHYELDLYHFLAVACGLISDNLLGTMIRVCELLTDEPDGGSAMIPLQTFLNIYGYLASLNCSSKQLIQTKTLSSQNVEIVSESSKLIEPSSSSSSSLSDNEKKFLSNYSISIEDSKSVCTHETSKTFDELISNESSEYWTTMVSDDKTIDDNIKCENSSSVNDITKDEHGTLVDDETSIKFIAMKEVTRAQHDESCDNTDEDINDTVVMFDEHVPVNKNRVSLIDLEESFSMTSDSSIGTEVTDEIPKLQSVSNDDIESALVMSAKKRSTLDQVGGDIGIGERSKAGAAEKFLGMVNEVVGVKKRKNHMVVDTNGEQERKQKQQQNHHHQEELALKSIYQVICECHEKSRRVKEIREDKTGPVQLPLGDEKPSGMIPPCNKVAEFIRKMEETTHPCVNYDVVGIGGVVSDERITKVGLWLTECARQQGGHVGPRNLRHFLCPSLYNNSNNDNDNDDVNNSRGAETN